MWFSEETPSSGQRPSEETITITSGDVAENHVGMQKIGVLSERGLSVEKLHEIREWFEERGGLCEWYDLRELLPEPERAEEAVFLLVRNGVSLLEVSPDRLLDRLLSLEWDTKAKMRGKVKNKLARYNLCFAETSQKADFEAGRGTVVGWDEVPEVAFLREGLHEELFLPMLLAEGNRYYQSKCGIGYHGDSERRIVVAARLRKETSLCFHWYLQGKRVGEKLTLHLGHGDLYFMSEKATGFDWKKRSIFTLRHAAGHTKYTA